MKPECPCGLTVPKEVPEVLAVLVVLAVLESRCRSCARPAHYETIILQIPPRDGSRTMTEQEKLQAFEARIANGEKIEPGDWMPERYRQQLIRMISQHAHSEVVGMLPEGKWIPHAPTLRRKLVLLAKVQDEAGHGQYLYHAAETLGVTREQMLDELLGGRAKYSSVFNYPTLSWADIGVIGWLVDGAAIFNQTMLARCSYGPYSRAMIRICAEETFHKKQGQDMVIRMARGTPAQEADGTKRDRPLVVAHADDVRPSRFGLEEHARAGPLGDQDKEQRRAAPGFCQRARPGTSFSRPIGPRPSTDIRLGVGNWMTGEIDWDEFWRVVKGQGPCNAERLRTRRDAHDEGRWVREAVEAYAKRNDQVARR